MPAKRDTTRPRFDRDLERRRPRSAGTAARQVAVTVQVVPGVSRSAQRFDLERPWPNPASVSTRLRFNCASQGFVTITVHTVFGQRVATPVRGMFQPGKHEVQWTATDDHGRRLMPGMYVVRMMCGKTTCSQKLAIAR